MIVGRGWDIRRARDCVRASKGKPCPACGLKAVGLGVLGNSLSKWAELREDKAACQPVENGNMACLLEIKNNT